MTDGMAVPTQVYRNIYRKSSPPACTLDRDDLVEFFAELEPKAREGVQLQLANTTRPADQTEEDFEALKESALNAALLSALVVGTDGEQVYVQSAEDLSTQRLPRRLASVTFDSSLNLRTTHNWQPENRFTVMLDFTEPPGFDRYDPTSTPTPNDSQIEVNGSNSTWVTGVNETIVSFLRERGTRRGWLHDHAVYNLYNWLIALPASLWVVFRIQEAVGPAISSMHGALRGALYIYLFLLAYLFGRGIAYGLRWTFPRIELKGSRSRKVRALVGTVIGGLLLALAYDVLQALFWSTPSPVG